VDEKIHLNNGYYACDTLCDGEADCSDCGNGSICNALGLVFSSGDFNNDQIFSTSECSSYLELDSSLLSFWNGYDTYWWSMSNEEKCFDVDTNMDDIIHSDEMVALSKHLLTLDVTSESTRQWEFENRYTQVSCEQCDWYQVYNF